MRPISIFLLATLFLLPGCKSDTRPVPRTFTGDRLYNDYRNQPRSLPLTAKESNDVLIRTDLKSTGDYLPVKPMRGNPRTYRFIYGGKYYWAYEIGPDGEKELYGPFELP